MLSGLEALYHSLQKLIGLHRQLMELVRSERAALEEADVNQIQEMTYGKEVLLHSIQQAEQERIRTLATLAASWRAPLKELTLQELITWVQGKDLEAADKLRSAQNTLKVLIERITEQNKENRRLVEKILEHVTVMKRNVLGEASPQAETYTQKGRRADPTAGSKLLSQEI